MIDMQQATAPTLEAALSSVGGVVDNILAGLGSGLRKRVCLDIMRIRSLS